MNLNAKLNTEALSIKPKSLIEERVRALYKGIPLSIGVTFVLALVLSIAEWNVIGHGELIIWNILMFCAMALRTANWFIWKNTSANIPVQVWLTTFRTGACLAGLAWGSASYFMFPQLNPTYQALLAFTLAGVASGSLTTLAIDRFSVLGFVLLAIAPLSIRLHLDQGPTAMPMSIMVFMFMIFVTSASGRARKQQEDNFEQSQRLYDWGNERLTQQHISKIVADAQTLFISENDKQETFKQLLADTLELSDSRIGFIGEVFYDAEVKPFLEMVAISDTPFAKQFNGKDATVNNPSMKLTNLNTLFGAALNTGRPIISNNPAQDMRAGGTPKGHPTLHTFMGIPIFSGSQQVAMLGLANKEQGYTENDTEKLKPILDLIAQFIVALRHQRQHIADEEKLKQHAKHTQTILDEAFDAILTIDSHGTLTSFNHAAEIIFGYRADQIIGQSVNLLMPQGLRSLHDEHLKNHQQSGFSKIIGMSREVVGLRRNGKEFPLEIAVSEIIENGERNYIGFARDISERKQSDKLKNEFIATVSHELRTPLTSISASLAIIESGTLGALPEKVNSLIQIAKQNSLRLQTLINDLLDMDKLLTNKITFNIKTFDANNMVQKAIDANKYNADKYRVKFQIASLENNCRIEADEVRAQQVLGHLLSNAAKFSTLHTNVDIAVAKKGDFIKISVTDKGTGIAPEFKKNIFTSFTQADSSSTRSKDGTGLGLAISKELIEKMGGKIGFTSSLGQGSCFYFELPAAKN